MTKKVISKKNLARKVPISRANQRRPAALSIVTGLCFILVVVAMWPKSSSLPIASVASLGQVCQEAQSSDTECQVLYYQNLYEQQGIQNAFADLKKEYEANPSVKSNCHQLTHVIGRAAAQKHSDVAEAYQGGNEFCWSGYYHGVMEGMLKKQSEEGPIADKLNSICESVKGKDAYSFNHYNCAHGLGHGIMLIEGDELFVSLETCDKLNDSWERESCYGGVFMENIMAHINPQHSTKYIKDTDPLYPCTAVKTQYANQCYAMQTSHSLKVLDGDYSKVFSLCAGIDAAHQATCYQSLGRDASGSTISDASKTHELCMLAPNPEAKEGCMIGAVKDFVSYNHSDTQATEFCSKFEEPLTATCNNTKDVYYQTF